MMKKDIKAEIMALRSTLNGKLFDDAQVHSDIYELNKLLNKMDTKEKTYTYKCNDCDEIYKFTHVQTYKNCTRCELRGEIRLQSIEVIDKEVDDE